MFVAMILRLARICFWIVRIVCASNTWLVVPFGGEHSRRRGAQNGFGRGRHNKGRSRTQPGRSGQGSKANVLPFSGKGRFILGVQDIYRVHPLRDDLVPYCTRDTGISPDRDLIFVEQSTLIERQRIHFHCNGNEPLRIAGCSDTA